MPQVPPRMNVHQPMQDTPSSSAHQEPPESVTLAARLILLSVALEILYQLLNVGINLTNSVTRASLGKQIRSMLEGTPEVQVTDSLVDSIALSSVVFSCLFGVAVQLILLILRRNLRSATKKTLWTRTLFIIFGCFYAVRGVMAFGARLSGDVALLLEMAFGITMILSAVVGVLIVILLMRKDTVEWVRRGLEL